MTISFVISIISASIAIFSLFFALSSLKKLRSLQQKCDVLFAGKKGTDLEEIILRQAEELKLLDGEIQNLFEISNKIHSLASKSIHKVGIIRFNPFKDIGSDQSFAVALLDGKNDGIVVSSLHTREGTRVYSKPIKNGAGDGYALTEEETTAINKATRKKTSKM